MDILRRCRYNQHTRRIDRRNWMCYANEQFISALESMAANVVLWPRKKMMNISIIDTDVI